MQALAIPHHPGSRCRPAVSVVMPVRNGMPYLPEAVESIRAQTFQDWELVVVLDRCSDGSGAYLTDCVREDNRVHLHATSTPGLVAALNQGLALARAPLVARMDADDLSMNQRLAAQMDYFNSHPETDVLGSLVQRCGTRTMSPYIDWLNSVVRHEELRTQVYIESPLAHPSVMFRTDRVMALGGYRETGGPEDYDLWLRCIHASYRFAKVPEVLLYWRDHDDRYSRTDARYSIRRFAEAKVEALCRGPLRDDEPVTIWGMGRTGRLFSSLLRSRGKTFRSFFDVDAAKIGRARYGVPIYGPEQCDEYLQPPVLAAVGGTVARQDVRALLDARGLVEGRHFWCVA